MPKTGPNGLPHSTVPVPCTSFLSQFAKESLHLFLEKLSFYLCSLIPLYTLLPCHFHCKLKIGLDPERTKTQFLLACLCSRGIVFLLLTIGEQNWILVEVNYHCETCSCPFFSPFAFIFWYISPVLREKKSKLCFWFDVKVRYDFGSLSLV